MTIENSLQLEFGRVVQRSKGIEYRLSALGAQGPGIGKRVDELKHLFDKNDQKLFEEITRVRNRVAHDINFKLSPERLKRFDRACRAVEGILDRHLSNLAVEDVKKALASAGAKKGKKLPSGILKKIQDTVAHYMSASVDEVYSKVEHDVRGLLADYTEKPSQAKAVGEPSSGASEQEQFTFPRITILDFDLSDTIDAIKDTYKDSSPAAKAGFIGVAAAAVVGAFMWYKRTR